MKVLSIGQLPKELGGSYTTGLAKVVFELSKQKNEGVQSFTYATNIEDTSAKRICTYPHQYIGYKYLIFRILFNILSHPIKTIRQWKIYQQENHINPLRFELYKANFERAIDLVNPDLIHLHGNGLAPLFYARKRSNVPIVLTCHGVFEREVNSNSQQKRYADYLTGLNEETKAQIVKYFCINPEKIEIIPNGVDTSKFYYSEIERKVIRSLLNVNETTTVFITVASVQERKGQLAFTKILKNLEGDWQYWIIGDGQDKQIILSFIAENNLQDKVKLLGYKNSNELYKYYSAADVYAHASIKEGQALCEIEAYTTGIRTVVNSEVIGTIAIDVHSNTYGYYVMDFNTPDLNDLKIWLGLKGENRHSNFNLDWSKIAELYVKYYKKIRDEKSHN